MSSVLITSCLYLKVLEPISVSTVQKLSQDARPGLRANNSCLLLYGGNVGSSAWVVNMLQHVPNGVCTHHLHVSLFETLVLAKHAHSRSKYT